MSKKTKKHKKLSFVAYYKGFLEGALDIKHHIKLVLVNGMPSYERGFKDGIETKQQAKLMALISGEEEKDMYDENIIDHFNIYKQEVEDENK